MEKILLSLTENQHKWLKELAGQMQISVSELLRRLLDDYRARQVKKGSED